METLRSPRSQQRLRARREPEIVRQFIRIANKEPGSESILRALTPETSDGYRQLADLLKRGPESVRKELVEAAPKDLHDKDFLRWAWRTQTATTIRTLLSAIADQNPTSPPKSARAIREAMEGRNGQLDSAPGRTYQLPPVPEVLSAFSLRMMRSEAGETNNRTMRAALVPAGPLKQFLEEVELDRIKRCAFEKCKKIFWAGRLDRPCCSDTCRNAYKQKRHRDRERKKRPLKKRR